MRKLILQEFVTLDGLAAGPDNSVDFVPAATKGDRSFGEEQLRLMDTVDMILLGRVTYEMFAGYWPNAQGEEKTFADKMGATPRLVFSRTLDRAPWGTWAECQIVRGAPPDKVTDLKGQFGKDIIMWGSISVARSLMYAGLIDEYRLVVCPVVLGSGRPLFGENIAIDMKLQNAKTLDRGAVYLRYGQSGTPSTGASEPRDTLAAAGT